MAKSDSGIFEVVEILIVIVVAYFLLKAFAGGRQGGSAGGGSGSAGLGGALSTLLNPQKGSGSGSGFSGGANLGSGSFAGNNPIPLNSLTDWDPGSGGNILGAILDGNENVIDNSFANDTIPLIPYSTEIGDPTFDQGFTPTYSEPDYNDSADDFTATISNDDGGDY